MRPPRAGLHGAVEHEQRGRRRHISVVAQHVPGMPELIARQPERLLHRFKEPAAAGMEQKPVEIRKPISVAVEKTLQRRTKLPLHERRQFGAEYDSEAV